MPGFCSDRNLLFGILALQMDFVTRDALIKGMNAWVLEKTRPLGEILREQGKLAEDEFALLDGLVRKHVEKHNDDPQQSLAAISSVGSVREDLQRIADPEVQASLAHVSAARQAEADSWRTNAASVGASTSSGLRFRILRPHAKGGLGQVSVARDEELKREVALKEIQRQHADQAESRSRFLLEAEVTGALEHPGIVPVYGLGSYADGRPFYAMRFIQGDSLKEAIAAFHAPQAQGLQPLGFHSLALRQLLGRFVDVCQAIEYAHARGVLHRDLKPGNIMLGKYGETLVVDWGLAKVLGKSDIEAGSQVSSGDSALTQAGLALGTPAFMSPEQAQGKVEELGPASDVYSLGATLYCLLTGQAPFSGDDVGAVLGKVQKGDFPRPRQVNAGVPAALEAVCLKAMALRMQDRYPSPRELAGEIEHWLADEPVAAHREPLPARMARAARKRPALTAGTVALLFTGVVAVAVGSLLVGREQQAKLAQQRKAREAQVGTLLDTAPQAVPAVLEALQPYRDEIRPLLQEAAGKAQPKDATDEAVRLWRQHRARAALALLAEDPEQKEPLTVRLLEEKLDPAEMLLVRDALQPHAAELKDQLWRQAREKGSKRAFRALVALAAYDPDSASWHEAAEVALSEMFKDPLHQGTWVEALRPVRQHLLTPLARVFRGEVEKLAEYRQVAANVLADYAADDAKTLAELLLAADAKQYAVIKPVLLKHPEEAGARMRKELAARPDYWKDPPLDPAWKEPAPDLVREVEQAGGLFAERFALCQALPLERVVAVTEGLRGAGYRPVRVRPWSSRSTGGPPVKDAPRSTGGPPVKVPTGGPPVLREDTGGPPVLREEVAIVWTRDGADWALKTGLTAAQVKNAPAGMIPADVAGYHTKAGERYAVLWRKPGKGEQAVVYAGVPEAQHQTKTGVFQNAGYLPATVQTLIGADGIARYSGVWWNGPDKPEQASAPFEPSPLLRWNDAEPTHDDFVFAGEHLLLDVHLGHAKRTARVPRHYASVWRDDTRQEAAGLHGLSADAHLARCRELAAQGYRPVALSLAALAGEKGPLAASAWHRPVVLAEQDRLASRQATAAATLLHLQQPAEVWPLFHHSPDPTMRSYLVERAGSRAVDPRLLVERLEVEKDVSARRALIVALGDFTDKELPATLRVPLVNKLLAWYRDDPDPGIHGAIDWLLRHAKEGPVARPLHWGQAKDLERIDKELAGRPPLAPPLRFGEGAGGRGSLRGRWYVNPQGQTFTLISGPVAFRMGSPLWEPDHIVVNEKPHRRIIPRSYAVMTKPVTVAQWQQFLKERPDVPKDYLKLYIPEPDGPIIQVSWYMAAQYCNWLSAKEGIPKDQWCYSEEIKTGVKPHPDYLRRTGYRLPSEAEWEYAARRQTASSRSYGAAVELLPRYGLFLLNAQNRAWPVGQKRPNDLGLFDMHGNVWTWCQDPAFVYPSGRIEDNEDIRDNDSRVFRGGSFSNLAPNVRSADRNVGRPANRYINVGVRPCRTYH